MTTLILFMLTFSGLVLHYVSIPLFRSTTMTYLLTLNKAELIFFPSIPHHDDGRGFPYVVQVIVKTNR